MGLQATFDLQTINGFPVVHATGEIDLSNVQEFESLLEKTLASEPTVVVISLGHVSYLDSTTFNTLVKFSRRFDGHEQGEILVVTPESQTGKRLFELVHLDGHLHTFDRIEDAMERAIQLTAVRD